MKKVSMIANKDLPYIDGRTVAAEEPFEIDEKFVQILTLSMAARIAEEEPATSGRGKRGKYSRRDMVAESPQ